MKVDLTQRQGFNIKQQQMVPPGRGQISPHIAYKAERVQTPARRRRGATGLAQVKEGGMECRREIKAWVFSERHFHTELFVFQAGERFQSGANHARPHVLDVSQCLTVI